jgi:hypothetical protein
MLGVGSTYINVFSIHVLSQFEMGANSMGALTGDFLYSALYVFLITSK